jgi:hypothetical protein
MIFHAMGVKAINPEYWVIDSIPDAISPVVLGNLHHSAQAERAQRRIVKNGGPINVCDSNACVVDHRRFSNFKIPAPGHGQGGIPMLGSPTRAHQI